MVKRLVSIGMVVLLCSLVGCGEAEDALDCDDICDAVEDCLGDIDASECRAGCLDQPSDEIEACEACLDTASCADCLDVCAPLLS